ncbi:hypothetical protein LEP1GSC021_0106 [Leptospira noguchii str. 1993005606]|nr:hypothetical protein LEP1GSC021_0106 [Leptospira noguchii str. 1993005606]
MRYSSFEHFFRDYLSRVQRFSKMFSMIQSTSFTNKGRNVNFDFLLYSSISFNPLPSQTKEEITQDPLEDHGQQSFNPLPSQTKEEIGKYGKTPTKTLFQSTSFTNKGRNTSIPRSKSKRFCFNPLPSQTKEEIKQCETEIKPSKFQSTSFTNKGRNARSGVKAMSLNPVSIHFLHKQRKKFCHKPLNNSQESFNPLPSQTKEEIFKKEHNKADIRFQSTSFTNKGRNDDSFH